MTYSENITLLVDGQSYLPTGNCSLTTKLSGIDQLEFSLPISAKTTSTKNSDIQLFVGNKKVFHGIVNSETVASGDSERSNAKIALGKIALLNNFYFYEAYQVNSQNTVAFFNQNPAGLQFQSYNLSGLSLAFSDKITSQNWYSELTDVARRFGFDFWYDYELDKVLLGTPDGGKNDEDSVKIDNDYLLTSNQNIKLPTAFSTDYTQVYNKIFVKGGVQNQIGMELVNIFDANYPIKNAIDPLSQKTYFYIEDTKSQAMYGVKQYLIDGVNLPQNDSSINTKTNISNQLYQLALQKLKQHKIPKTTFRDIEIYDTNNSLNHKKVITFDCEIGGLLVAGTYMISQIDTKIDRDSNQLVKKCTLVSYLDKDTQIKRLLDISTKKDDAVLSNTSSGATVNITGTYDTKSNSYSFGSGNYAVPNNYKYLTSYIVGVSSNNPNFALSGLQIDGVEMVSFGNSIDIINGSLSPSAKSFLSSSGNHTVSVSGSGIGDVVLSLNVAINGVI
jgi:hypothetical protein